jgi:comEA protein
MMQTLFKRVREYLAFTKNEQKVFLFLAVVFLTGVAIKAYKAYVVPDHSAHFDYSQSDSVFAARSQRLLENPDTAVAAATIPLRININSATKKELIQLPGIGEAVAERILLYRDENGKFRTIQNLKNVKGIGDKKFEKLKPFIEAK